MESDERDLSTFYFSLSLSFFVGAVECIVVCSGNNNKFRSIRLKCFLIAPVYVIDTNSFSFLFVLSSLTHVLLVSAFVKQVLHANANIFDFRVCSRFATSFFCSYYSCCILAPVSISIARVLFLAKV